MSNGITIAQAQIDAIPAVQSRFGREISVKEVETVDNSVFSNALAQIIAKLV